MVIGVQRGIEHGSEGRKQPVMSESESVMNQSLVTSGGANRAPIGHEGFIFFNQTLGSPSGE
jgi:hypothetical protein